MIIQSHPYNILPATILPSNPTVSDVSTVEGEHAAISWLNHLAIHLGVVLVSYLHPLQV